MEENGKNKIFIILASGSLMKSSTVQKNFNVLVNSFVYVIPAMYHGGFLWVLWFLLLVWNGGPFPGIAGWLCCKYMIKLLVLLHISRSLLSTHYFKKCYQTFACFNSIQLYYLIKKNFFLPTINYTLNEYFMLYCTGKQCQNNNEHHAVIAFNFNGNLLHFITKYVRHWFKIHVHVWVHVHTNLIFWFTIHLNPMLLRNLFFKVKMGLHYRNLDYWVYLQTF